ncbi:hypothetical protein ACLMJK_006450 [Lecanora helva]
MAVAAAQTGNPEAWQIGVQQYLSRLPDSQKATFKAPANADTCLAMIVKAQSRKKGFTRLMELFRPLIEPLKRFEGTIDVLTQTHGALASPIWGPLRMAILIASDHFKTLESLTLVLHRIISSLERFTNYEKLFRDDPAVQKAIGALYSDLLDFCARVVRFHSGSSFRAVVLSFDKEFREVSDYINLHSAEIDHIANAVNIAESKKAREIEESHRKTQLQNNLQRWLSPANVQDDLYRHQLAYMPGSCNWILKTSQAETLLSPTISSTMKIQGRPGAGKTVLTSFLVKWLIDQQAVCTLYFFCKAGHAEKSEEINVIRTLLAQLLHQDPSLYDYLESHYTRSGRAVADSFVEVCTCFQLALANTTRHRIHIIIDALDECENVTDLLRVIIETRDSVSAEINIIVTCRPVQIIFPFDHVLDMDSASSGGSIKQYIERRLSQIQTWSDDGLKMTLVNQIASEADGLWLYARLMLDELERLPSAALIQRNLRFLPHGLTQLYTQILRSKETTFTDMELQFAQQIYLWLDVSDYMPSFLSIDYLSYDSLSLILQKVNFSQPVFDPISLVSNLCSPLIRATDVIGDELTAPFQDFEITSTHHTADQYIRESQDLPTSSLPQILKPRKLRQLYRGETAIWYFTECKSSEQSLLRYQANPLDEFYGSFYDSHFEMSYGIWGALQLTSIPRDLDPEQISVANRLIQRFTNYIDPNSWHCLRWVETAIIINYAGRWRQLLGNAEQALETMETQGQIYGFPALETYRLVRLTFFRDYVYVLRATGPGEQFVLERDPTPSGFYSRPLAVKILEIGQKWQYLHGSFTQRMFSLETAIDAIQQQREAAENSSLEDLQGKTQELPIR